MPQGVRVQVPPRPQKELIAAEETSRECNVFAARDIRVAEVETECVVEQFEDAEYRDHDEHPDDAPEHVLFAFIGIAALVELPEKFHEPVDKEQEAERKNDQYCRVDDVRLKTVHYV